MIRTKGEVVYFVTSDHKVMSGIVSDSDGANGRVRVTIAGAQPQWIREFDAFGTEAAANRAAMNRAQLAAARK